MFIIEDNPRDFEEPLTEEQRNKVKLMVLAEETKKAAVAKEYMATRKKQFYHPEHFYEMSACKYNVKKHRAVEPLRKGLVELNDEEYLFLLTKLLVFGSSYHYKHLYGDKPITARRIIEQLYGSYEEQGEGLDYHVVFDEVFENAREIMQLKDYYFPGNENRTELFF